VVVDRGWTVAACWGPKALDLHKETASDDRRTIATVLIGHECRLWYRTALRSLTLTVPVVGMIEKADGGSG
jgi:hypothetical protein